VVLWALLAVIVLAAAAIHWLSQRALQRRIAALQAPLEQLASGSTGVTVPDRRRDSIGRIGAMIERTSRLLARQRDRLRYLEHLSSWLEASRRQAHQIRTPLTAARMETEALHDLAGQAPLPLKQNVRNRADSILEELDHLARFTQELTSFARIPRPMPVEVDLVGMAHEFCTRFANAWPNLDLAAEPGSELPVMLDRDMIRNVLMNLCTNSALALGERSGRCTLIPRRETDAVILDVADNGPGIDADIAGRIFEPYVTTRKIGEGMGLGLAIARKIMLDHGGDLELTADTSRGATFSLRFPPSRDGAT
jgi:nitrogen fixation/metabolism regulation signal transduction histidine kinase/HAMP domain-containing protein